MNRNTEVNFSDQMAYYLYNFFFCLYTTSHHLQNNYRPFVPKQKTMTRYEIETNDGNNAIVMLMLSKCKEQNTSRSLLLFFVVVTRHCAKKNRRVDLNFGKTIEFSWPKFNILYEQNKPYLLRMHQNASSKTCTNVRRLFLTYRTHVARYTYKRSTS